jgi:hypothetical protein
MLLAELLTNERKLTGGEKRSKEAWVKKLKPHIDDENMLYAVATNKAKGVS